MIIGEISDDVVLLGWIAKARAYLRHIPLGIRVMFWMSFVIACVKGLTLIALAGLILWQGPEAWPRAVAMRSGATLILASWSALAIWHEHAYTRKILVLWFVQMLISYAVIDVHVLHATDFEEATIPILGLLYLFMSKDVAAYYRALREPSAVAEPSS